LAYKEFKSVLETQQIDYIDFETKPGPFNTILWTANVDIKDAYLIGHYSFFDKKPIEFEVYPKNHALLGDLITNDEVKRMIKISQGCYSTTQKHDTLFFNDLR